LGYEKVECTQTENPNLEDWDFSLTLTTNNHKTKIHHAFGNPNDDENIILS